MSLKGISEVGILDNYFERMNIEDKTEIVFEELKKNFASQVSKVMKDKNISKKKLAEMLGVSPSYITKLLGGDNISLKVMARVIAVLGVQFTMELHEKFYNNILPSVDIRDMVSDEVNSVK